MVPNKKSKYCISKFKILIEKHLRRNDFEKFKKDFKPIDKNCACELCQNYSRAYLHHLFASKEPLAMRLASIHNLKFYLDLMRKLRGEK